MAQPRYLRKRSHVSLEVDAEFPVEISGSVTETGNVEDFEAYLRIIRTDGTSKLVDVTDLLSDHVKTKFCLEIVDAEKDAYREGDRG